MILLLFVGFLLGAAAIIFALENTEIVALTFLTWQFESSLAILVILAVITGVLISLLISLPSAVSDSFRLMNLKSENRKLTKEVREHREAAAPTIVVADPASPVVDLRNS